MATSARGVATVTRQVRLDGAVRALLYALPLAVAFGSLAPVGVGQLRAGVTDVIVAAAVALAAVAIWRERDHQTVFVSPAATVRHIWREQPQALAVLAALALYLLVIVLSIVTAYTRTPVIKETLKWGEVLAVTAVTWWAIHTERQALWLAWAVIIAGLAEALLGCVQDVIATGLLGPGGASVRVFGTFDQPNPYGGYLNLSLPIALALVVCGRDARMRWVAAGAAILSVFAQNLAGSRGALLGLAAAVVVIAALAWRKERQALIALAVGAPLVAIAWFTHLIPARIEEKVLAQFRVNGVSLTAQVNDANFSTIERLAHWVAGLRMFQAHPLLGVGAGNYGAAYQQYKVPGWDESLTHAHNYYINAAAETGALGLVAFLLVVGAALWLAWRATRATDPQRATHGALAGVDARAIAIGCVAVVVGLCVHNLTDNLFVHAMELQFALTLGLLARLSQPLSQKAHTTRAA